MANKLLTIVAFIDNEDYLDRFKNSVLNQKLNENELEIVFVDPICSETTKQLIKYFGDNRIKTKYFGKQDATESEAYAFAIEHINSKYVNFSRVSSYFKPYSIRKSLFKNDSLFSYRPVFVNSNGKETVYKAIPLNKTYGKIDLISNPTGFQLFLSAFFIPTKILKNVSFDLELKEEALYKFVIDLLANVKTYRFLKTEYFYTHALENTTGVAEIQHNKWWYTDSVENFIIPTFKKYINLEFVKNICIYLVLAKYNCNLFARNKNVLNIEEVKQFDKSVGKFLALIDDDSFYFNTSNLHLKLARSLMIHLLKLKYEQKGCQLKSRLREDEFVFSVLQNGEEVSQLPIVKSYDENVVIDIINYDNGNLIIDGIFCPAEYLVDDEFEAYADLKGEKYPLLRNEIYPENYSFGVSFYKKYRFNVKLPANKSGNIKFYFEYNNQKVPLKIASSGAFCRINCWRNSYWHFSKNSLYYSETKYKGDFLRIRKNNPLANFFKEIIYILKNLLKKRFSKKSIIASGFRVIYWLSRPFFYKRKIWLYFDKLYKAGDNAEYLFSYAYKQNDNIENYYILNRDSADYKRLKSKYGKHIIVFNSFKAKLYALNAECVLATHANVMGFLGYPKRVHPFFTNLYKLKVVCIQHGLTIQQIAVHQNRLVDNTALYCCASKFEIDNLNQNIYGYSGDELKLVGLARYDGLKNNDKKQILITPTWRKECARGDTQMGSARKYNELFKTTEYFRLYNELINDKDLISAAKEYGYKLIYLLHPVVSSQINDFTKNDFVEILAASGEMSYEKILTESSLMVTDYSGVQFDFAYQRKPIVYYHPSTLPPHYDEGCGFIYNTMGFGPIVTEHKALVNELCSYMKNECKIKETYVKRADDFFSFKDFDNCKRIYKEVKNHIDK